MFLQNNSVNLFPSQNYSNYSSVINKNEERESLIKNFIVNGSKSGNYKAVVGNIIADIIIKYSLDDILTLFNNYFCNCYNPLDKNVMYKYDFKDMVSVIIYKLLVNSDLEKN